MNTALRNILTSELRHRGTTLDSYASAFGLSPERLVQMVDGQVEMPVFVELDLSETLGVSVKRLRTLQ